MNWQRIESAPMDGTWVLLTGGEMDDQWYGGTPEPRVCAARYDAKWDFWGICDWDGALRSGYRAPTHWMPLPEPPK